MSSEPNSGFYKRPGTTDKGKQYEDLLVAFITLDLTLNDDVTNFVLSSNDKQYGDFDDIVVRITYKNNKKEEYAIQLKHKEVKKNITKNQLAAAKGDFSLERYYQSYEEIKSRFGNVDKSYCVLYTCAGFERSQSFYLAENKDVKVEAKVDKISHFFDTSAKNLGVTFARDDKKQQDFFEHFLFLPNQKNVEELEDLVTAKFRAFSSDVTICEKYLSFIKKWSEADGRKDFLIKKKIKLKIGQLLISSHLKHISLKNSLIKEACSKFDVTILETLEETIFEDTQDEIQVVEANDTVYAAVSLILESSDTKFILVGDVDVNKLEKYNVFKSLKDLEQHPEIYNQICNHKVSLQARPSVTLSSLLSNEKAQECFTVDAIINILMGRNTGENKEVLPEPYIHQKLLKTVIDIQFLHSSSSLCVLSNWHESDIKGLRHQVLTVDAYLRNKQPKSNFQVQEKTLIAADRCSFNKFRQICERNPTKIVHHFRLHGDQLEWLASQGSIQELLQYRRPSMCVLESEIIDVSNNINVICSHSGMGKSEMLKFIRNNVSGDYWTILVKISDHSNFLKKIQDPQRVLEHLLEHQRRSNRYQNFEIKIREKFVQEKKLMILWDGLDEFSDDKVTLRLVQTIDSMSGYVHWATTRNNFFGDNLFPFVIKPVEDKDQEAYIASILKTRFSECEIRKVVEKITKILQATNSTGLLGIPLQLDILAQLFCQNPDKYSSLAVENFTLADMMRYCVKEKIKFGHSKLIAGKLRDIPRVIQKQIITYKLQQYEILALKTYLSEDDLKNIPNCVLSMAQTPKKDECAIITNSENCSFFHRSCGEYFVASWFSKNFKDIANFQDFFFKDTYRNIRRMFDIIMCKNCPAHLTILYENFDGFNYSKEQLCLKDKLGRIPLDLIFSYGTPHHRLATATENIIDFDTGNVVQEESDGYKTVVKFLLNHQDPFLKDEFQLNCVDYALKTFSLYAVDATMAKYSVDLSLLENVYGIATLVFYAVRFLYTKILESVGSIPYFESKDSCNLLHLIPQWGNRSVFLKKLLENETYVQRIDHFTQIKKTIIRGFGLIVETPSDVQSEVVTTEDESFILLLIQESPLHFASIFGDYDSVEMLLKKGANANCINNGRSTPLHYAVQRGKLEIARLLVNFGSVLNQFDSNGENELHLALKANSPDLVEYLLETGTCIALNKGTQSPLDGAIALNRSKCITILLKAKNFSGLTCNDFKCRALSFAVFHGNKDVFFHILKVGVNLFDSYGIYGQTPLHTAVYSRRLEMLNILLQTFKVDLTDLDGSTPLHYACILGFEDILTLLITFGANVNKKNKFGLTPLHFASTYQNNPKVIQVLLNYGAVIDSQNHLGGTPLYNAVYFENKKVIDILIEKGADTSKPDDNGITPNIINLLQHYWINNMNFHKHAQKDSLGGAENEKKAARIELTIPNDPWLKINWKGCILLGNIPNAAI